MDSNSRQYIVIGGGYVGQGPTAPKYRAILPKQPVVPRILEQQPLTTANFKLLTYNLQPTPPADLEEDISVDQRLQDTNMVQTKTVLRGLIIFRYPALRSYNTYNRKFLKGM